MNKITFYGLKFSIIVFCMFFVISCVQEKTNPYNMRKNSLLSFKPKIENSAFVATRTGGKSSENRVLTSIKLKSVKPGLKGKFFLNVTQGDFNSPNVKKTKFAGTSTQTRTAPVESMYNSFVLYAYEDKGTGFKKYKDFAKKEFTFSSSDNTWNTDKSYYWPSENSTMKFYAYAPVDFGSIAFDYPSVGNFATSINDNVQEQKDLIVAVSSNYTKSDSQNGFGNDVDLTFKHVLSAIKFVTGKDIQNGKITSVILKNIYRGFATYNMESGEWAVPNNASKTNYSLDLNLETVENRKGDAIGTADQTLLLLPQTLSSDAQIEVKGIDEDGVPFDVTGNLQNPQGTAKWEPGKSYTYQISNKSIILGYDYKLVIQKAENDGTQTYEFGENGISNDRYKVYAYKQKQGTNIKRAINWYLEFSDDNHNWKKVPPYWLKGLTLTGKSDENNPEKEQYYSFSIPYFPPQSNIELAANQEKGTELKPWNLSNDSGAETVMNTANCYIVDAPGWYSFPLVYGNAIKHGADNPSSYHAYNHDGSSKHEQSGVLENFFNHLTKWITTPYINDNEGCTAFNASLVWQDAKDLVNNIEYDPRLFSGKGGILFYVDPATIQEGNAVIEVKDQQNNVMWSWHIWVTNRIKGHDVTVIEQDGTKFDFMIDNLGHCEAYNEPYKKNARGVYIRVNSEHAPEDTDKYPIFIGQDRDHLFYGNNCTFYQWGRKDPLPPGCGINYQKEYNNINHTWNKKLYIDNRSSVLNYPKLQSFEGGTNCLVQGIRHPESMNGNANMDNAYYNLWNSICDKNIDYNYTTSGPTTEVKLHTTVVKTVYDPCPVGYVVPVLAAFIRFSTTGTSSGNIYGNFNEDPNSLSYYMGVDDSGKASVGQGIRFCAMGVRYCGDGNIYDKEYGNYWLAYSWYDSPISNSDKSDATSKSFGLSIYANWRRYGIYNYEGNHKDRAWGWPVRPIRDALQ